MSAFAYLPDFFTDPSQRLIRAWQENGGERDAEALGVTLELLWYAADRVWVQNVEARVAGRGAGTKALRALGELADAHGVTLLLYAKPFGRDPMSLEELVVFYRRVGFQPDDGVISPHTEYDFDGRAMLRPVVAPEHAPRR